MTDTRNGQQRIEPADLEDPAVQDFLQAHLDDITPTAPAESQHVLTTDAMRATPDFKLWAAYRGAELAGTVGLAPVSAGHEELKSMRTAAHHRGHGIGKSLLDHALADATARGILTVSLETGSMEFFAPARALYLRAGFMVSGAFGTYSPDDPNSTFMTITLGHTDVRLPGAVSPTTLSSQNNPDLLIVSTHDGTVLDGAQRTA